MSTLADVVSALAGVAESAGFRAYDYPVDNPQPPCAQVYPSSANFETVFGTSADWTLTLDLIYPTASERSAWQQLYEDIDNGITSIRALLDADSRCGLSDADYVIRSVTFAQVEEPTQPRVLVAQFTVGVVLDNG